MKSTQFIFVLFGLSLAAPAIAGKRLRCNTQQSFCVLEDKRLTIGDEVAILNDHDEVVATGEVSYMNGSTRRLQIKKRHGEIKKTHTAQLMQQNVNKAYRIYERPKPRGIGATLDLTQLNIDGGANALGAQGFYEQHYRLGLKWVARGQFFTASGVSADTSRESGESAYSLNGINLLGGASYKFFRRSPFALRSEVALGLTYVSLDAEGYSYPKPIEKIGNGVGLAARAGADLIYTRMGDWQPMASAAISKIHNARGVTLAIGMLKQFK